MFEAPYSVLSVFEAVNQVYGRKKIQKMIHLLEASGAALPFKYEYHFYGPYSAELQETINFLVSLEFLTENKDDDAYVYEITERGKAFKQTLESHDQAEVNLNPELLSALSGEKSQFLEMVSTYAFLMDSNYTPEEARLKAHELKPHLAGLLERAIAFYHSKVRIAGAH